MEFKVGDRVTLTGGDWNDTYTAGLMTGDALTIGEIDADGAFRFVGFEEDGWWDVAMEGWEVELNTDTPLEHFAKTAAKFAGDPLSTEDIEKLKTLGEQLGISSFEQSVRYHTNKIADLLISKNKAYGDSALNPVRIFSKADRTEQLNVRIDDKISRIQRGTDFGDEDTVRDLIGYLVLRLIAEESE